MAKSLAKIQEQIARLQKEADSIQSSVITRVKKEIAQYGLTVEHLFGSSAASGKNTPKFSSTTSKTPKAKASAAKPAKYADQLGNTWHGIGKRPQWIHDALNAGQALVDFLVTSKKTPNKSKASATTAPKATRKVAAKKAPAKKSSAKATPAKKSPKAAAVKKTAARKPKAAPAAEAPQAAA